MLHDPSRHEPCSASPWDEARARAAIGTIVADTEAHFSASTGWPIHPRDRDPGDDASVQAFHTLYHGSCGVIWALHRLRALGAVQLQRDLSPFVPGLLALNRAGLGADAQRERASYLMGDTPILLLMQSLQPAKATLDGLDELIAGNLEHPARELMWGAPGTMLAGRCLYRHTGQARWAEHFRRHARQLWSQLIWSDAHQCHYWTQDLYGTHSSYLDAVHGFAATASVLIGGRDLLDQAEWARWQACIENTMRRSATVESDQANWQPWLIARAGSAPRWLMQFCHGAPGFVVCLGDLPGAGFDDLLLKAGQATWAAGPLLKGSNLCHGTGGNGYAFLKLWQRTRDPLWLQRARAFAMHAIGQCESERQAVGHGRHSLWTGDPGLALYLWDCIEARSRFPTLDGFFDGEH